MDRDPEYLTRRTAEYLVKNLLIEQGYKVFRVARRYTSPVPFHLIAWRNTDDLIFIRVGGSRIRRRSSSLEEELTRLSCLVRTVRYPGELQYWVREGDTWAQYRIFAGGSVRIPGAGSDIR